MRVSLDRSKGIQSMALPQKVPLATAHGSQRPRRLLNCWDRRVTRSLSIKRLVKRMNRLMIAAEFPVFAVPLSSLQPPFAGRQGPCRFGFDQAIDSHLCRGRSAYFRTAS